MVVRDIDDGDACREGAGDGLWRWAASQSVSDSVVEQCESCGTGVSKCVGKIGAEAVVVLELEVDPWTSRRATGDNGDRPCARKYETHDS